MYVNRLSEIISVMGFTVAFYKPGSASSLHCFNELKIYWGE